MRCNLAHCTLALDAPLCAAAPGTAPCPRTRLERLSERPSFASRRSTGTRRADARARAPFCLPAPLRNQPRATGSAHFAGDCRRDGTARDELRDVYRPLSRDGLLGVAGTAAAAVARQLRVHRPNRYARNATTQAHTLLFSPHRHTSPLTLCASSEDHSFASLSLACVRSLSVTSPQGRAVIPLLAPLRHQLPRPRRALLY